MQDAFYLGLKRKRDTDQEDKTRGGLRRGQIYHASLFSLPRTPHHINQESISIVKRTVGVAVVNRYFKRRVGRLRNQCA